MVNSSREPMLDMYLFETVQLVEQLEQIILRSEEARVFDSSEINEIFRIMHTIKGSSAMMMFNDISSLAHAVEDLFYFIREEHPERMEHFKIADIVLNVIDFIKNEILKIENENIPGGDPSLLIESIKSLLLELKSENKENTPKTVADETVNQVTNTQKFYLGSLQEQSRGITHTYEACIFFEDGCEMENIRAFTLVHNLKDKIRILDITPPDIVENNESAQSIRANGFRFIFKTDFELNEAYDVFLDVPYINNLELKLIETEAISGKELCEKTENKKIVLNEENVDQAMGKNSKQNYISVKLEKLDKLMDLVGEIVISEALVTRNPDLKNLKLNNFMKASRQLNKLTSELQDIVMSIRMVPLTATFQKMNRIVRDMSKKLNKEVSLEVIGEDTEVDKNIIENISDPIMHLIRNSLDHGLESIEERVSKGKPPKGKLTLEAKNSDGDVWIKISDDGRGLSKDKILAKAKENGLVVKPESELTEKEIFNFILMPGFSTKEQVTEFSGRGVGMDVVVKNIKKVGGTIIIDSTPEIGTIMTVKIPLTLTIIDGMLINVGDSSFIIPTVSIRESFRPKEGDVFKDPDDNEMILIRGRCYPLLRIHELYKIKAKTTRIEEGIIVMIHNEHQGLCIFADSLVGEQQVVVKGLPKYINRVDGITGCTMLGDGSISLIIDTGALLNKLKER